MNFILNLSDNPDSSEQRSFISKALQLTQHQPPGPNYTCFQKRLAHLCLQDQDELEAIFHLSEAHAPSLRLKATYRFDRMLDLTGYCLTMNRGYIAFDCPKPFEEHVKTLLKKIADMPKEWTIVQLTTAYNQQESLRIKLENDSTDAIHISVFNCGQKAPPFCVTVSAPVDPVNGQPIELYREMLKLIKENKEGSTVNPEKKNSIAFRKKYYNHRLSINNRFKEIVDCMETKWLREWRCLLYGKLVDKKIQNDINRDVKKFLASLKVKITGRTKMLFNYIIMGNAYLLNNEIRSAINECFPDKEMAAKTYSFVMDLNNKYFFKHYKRHPVILIVDDKLDMFPWEVMDILKHHPVSRMPSVHFTYGLYKEHEDTIVDGLKVIEFEKGSFVINPGLDLRHMQARLEVFYKYWIPRWEGISGVTPTADEFDRLLKYGEVFLYNGHGNGTQFLSGDKIQRSRIEAVVMLFGCSSVRLYSLGPYVEMNGFHYQYLIACSPCVIGMLWDVTDFDTDTLSTALISRWIKSDAKTHWKFIDKQKWYDGDIVKTKQKPPLVPHPDEDVLNEPELLRAVSIARTAPKHFCTEAALVARGLPVILQQK